MSYYEIKFNMEERMKLSALASKIDRIPPKVKFYHEEPNGDIIEIETPTIKNENKTSKLVSLSGGQSNNE